ncbi:MAG: YigZ family protein [Chitinophagaceae bacterium]|nr:YigZ family protein [Chitinophagaceae bacterium]
MPDSDFYNTIGKPGIAEFKDRGSRFIAYAFPVNDIHEFKLRLAEIKNGHPKATHHCFAYRIGQDGNTFRVSDDGEPSGSAGRPILGQIDSKQLKNVLIIVVRYFGGTLLGVPGLINAYKTAAVMVLQIVAIIRKPVETAYRLQFDYTQLGEAMKIIKAFNCNVLKRDIQLFCHLEINIASSCLEQVLLRLGEIKGVELKRIA